MSNKNLMNYFLIAVIGVIGLMVFPPIFTPIFGGVLGAYTSYVVTGLTVVVVVLIYTKLLRRKID